MKRYTVDGSTPNGFFSISRSTIFTRGEVIIDWFWLGGSASINIEKKIEQFLEWEKWTRIGVGKAWLILIFVSRA